jgi:hemerythrin superfamily protein
MSIKSKIKTATNAVVKALTPENDAENADILDTLKQEHDELKSLLVDLQDAQTATQRKSLIKKIKAALVPHAKAEEKVVYNAVIALKDKAAQIDGEEGYLEHELAAKTLQRLESLANATSPEHKAAGKVLKELLEHHIDEEERNVWKDVKQHFSDDERASMNRAFLTAKQRVKL